MYHLFNVFKQVIGRWLSFVNSPGNKLVFPPENHKGQFLSNTAVASKLLAMSWCKTTAFFHQKFARRSGPGALQFFFFLVFCPPLSPVSLNSVAGISGTTFLIASLISSIYSIPAFPLPVPSHNVLRNSLASSISSSFRPVALVTVFDYILVSRFPVVFQAFFQNRNFGFSWSHILFSSVQKFL